MADSSRLPDRAAGKSSGHGPSAVSNGHGHAPYENPDVRFEMSDVQASGVVAFAVSLAVMIVVFAGLLVVLFHVYEDRPQKVAVDQPSGPLVETDSGRLPREPRLEGIVPQEDIGRAWGNMDSQDAQPWLGYNVRLVAPPELAKQETGETPADRDRQAIQTIEKQIGDVNKVLSSLAGKLPVRSKPADALRDEQRRSAGASNSGRSAGGGAP